MGNGMCSRKQKRIFQTLLLLTVVFGFLYGAMLYYELQGQLRKAEATALKYQQHQESLSAQLQGTPWAGGSAALPQGLQNTLFLLFLRLSNLSQKVLLLLPLVLLQPVGFVGSALVGIPALPRSG